PSTAGPRRRRLRGVDRRLLRGDAADPLPTAAGDPAHGPVARPAPSRSRRLCRPLRRALLRADHEGRALSRGSRRAGPARRPPGRHRVQCRPRAPRRLDVHGARRVRPGLGRRRRVQARPARLPAGAGATRSRAPRGAARRRQRRRRREGCPDGRAARRLGQPRRTAATSRRAPAGLRDHRPHRAAADPLSDWPYTGGPMANAVSAFIDDPAAGRGGARVAIATRDGATTYRDLLGLVGRAGNVLRGLGVEPEQRVAILLPDGVEWVATFFGAVRIGAVAVPLNTRLPPAEWVVLLRDSRARVLVAEPTLLGALQSALSEVPHLRAIVATGAGAGA